MVSSAAAAPPMSAEEVAQRCTAIRKTVAAAADMPALAAAFEANGDLGVAMGERFETKTSLISFCVVVDPALVAGPCMKPLGFDRPIVHDAMTRPKKKWAVANSAPKAGKPLATRLPRYGPASVTAMIEKPHGKSRAGAPKRLPFHDFDGKRDVIVELCFVDKKLGE